VGTRESVYHACAKQASRIFGTPEMDVVVAALAPYCPSVQAFQTESEFLVVCVGGWKRATGALFGGAPRCVSHHTALLYARAAVFRAGGADGWAYSIWMSAHVRMVVRLFAGGWPTPEVYPRFDVAEGPHRGIDTREIFHFLDFCSSSPSHINTADACSHIISKGLPKRCQIRELNRFLASYADKQDTRCVVLIHTMLISTLCGLYPHCREKMPFSVIVRVVASLSHGGNSGLSSWLLSKEGNAATARGNTYTSQAICFYAIREFIVYSVSKIPSLRACLLQHAQWGLFEQKVVSTCDHARRAIAKNASTGGHDCPLFKGVGAAVSTMHRTQRRKRERTVGSPPRPRCSAPNGHNGLDAFLGAIPRGWPAFLDECRKQGCTPIGIHASAIEKITSAPAKGVAGIIPRLVAHGVGGVAILACKEILLCIHSGGGMATFNKKLREVMCDSLSDYALLENELMVARTQLRTTIHAIPESWSVAAEGAIGDTWGQNRGPHAGCVTFCGSCREIKCAMCEGRGSVRRGSRKRDKQSASVAGARVASSIRACVDEDTMELFCERIHNSQGSACRAMKIMASAPPTNKHKNMSSLGTYLSNAICASWCKTMPLLSVPVSNQILFHDSTLFVLCCVCSCVTRIGKATSSSPPLCKTCTKKATDKVTGCVCCFHKQTIASVIVSCPALPAVAGRVCAHCSGVCVVKGRQVQELSRMRHRHAAAALLRDTRDTRASKRPRQTC